MPRKTAAVGKTTEKRAGRRGVEKGKGKAKAKEKKRVTGRRVMTRRMSAMTETTTGGSGDDDEDDDDDDDGQEEEEEEEEEEDSDDESDRVDINIRIIELLKELEEIGNQGAKSRAEQVDGYRRKINMMRELILQQSRVTALEHVAALRMTVEEAISATRTTAVMHGEVDGLFGKKREENGRMVEGLRRAVVGQRGGRALAWEGYVAGGQK